MSKYTDVYNHKKDEEETKPERFTKAQVGLIALGVVGAGMGIFGFARGYRLGYNRGTQHGFIASQYQFLEATKVIAAEARKTEGE